MRSPGPDDLPEVAVAMLYHSKLGCVLGEALEAIYRQDYPKSKIHLILADNMSRDDAHAIVEKWLEKCRRAGYASITHVRVPGNVPHVRNVCLRIAISKGLKLLFFVDSDVILTPDSLRRVVRTFLSSGDRVFVVALPYFIPLENDSLFVRVKVKYGKGPYRPLLRRDKPYEVPSIGMGATLINLDLIPVVGFFDEEIPYIEDLNLTRRAVRLGYKVLLDPRVQLLHKKRVTTLQSLKKVFQTGPSELLNIKRNRLYKEEVRSLTYWSAWLISLVLVPVSPVPLIALTALGWLVYSMRFRGWGKLVGYPVMAVYRVVRLLGMMWGLLVLAHRRIRGKSR
ncbi:MAG: hypothetical protein DRJ67_09030 [Thermoprotei archaeon]|nr:MAG: hypothetical protein DRJ67_09030 [Thermoprotei archaeon]